VKKKDTEIQNYDRKLNDLHMFVNQEDDISQSKTKGLLMDGVVLMIYKSAKVNFNFGGMNG
jgi:hypothetical protein